MKNFRSKSFANKAAEALAIHHFLENLGKKVGQSMDFTMKFGEKWRGVFPWNQLQQSDFHISGGSKLRNGFYHQNMWGFTLC